jgi:hypothetical protein
MARFWLRWKLEEVLTMSLIWFCFILIPRLTVRFGLHKAETCAKRRDRAMSYLV